MLGTNRPRKALASALSQIVLSHDTILRHAAVLARPDLIEIPAPASALGLWSAVIERAEAEAMVPKLVQAVLDENPAADALKAALQEWLDATRSVPPAPPTTAHPGARPMAPAEPPSRGGHGAWRPRWAVAVVAGLVISWSLLQWRPTRVRIFQLFKGPHAAVPTEGELAEALLDCWNQGEGSDPRHPEATTWVRINGDNPRQRSSTVTVRLVKGQPGQFNDNDDQGVLLSASTNTPRFKRCVRGAKKDLLSRMAPGSRIQAEVALPLKF